MSADLHVYHRKIVAGAGDSLARIAERIPAGVVVLDVGTGTGALGEFLAGRQCTVDGANYNEAELEIARPHYRALVVADLERALLSELFPDKRYDVIVFGDVLEHLRNPARTLADARALLAPGGRVLISVPNIAHVGVVASLLAGEFTYTPEGILDDTHVRFFTRASLIAMIASCGLKPAAWDAVTKPLSDTEFHDRHPDAFTPALAKALTASPDALVYQFIVEAVDEREPVPVAALPARVAPELAFIVQLYFAAPAEPFAEERSSKTLASIGKLRQRVSLPIGLEGPMKLRLDPADRPGTMKLLRARIVDAAGESVWTWNGSPDAFDGRAGLVVVPNGFGKPGVTLGLLTEDPSLSIALGEVVVPAGARLECEIDWPMSPDTLALSQVFLEQLAPRTGSVAPLATFGAEHDVRRIAELLDAARSRELELAERVRRLEGDLAREHEARAAREAEARASEASHETIFTRLLRKPRS